MCLLFTNKTLKTISVFVLLRHTYQCRKKYLYTVRNHWILYTKFTRRKYPVLISTYWWSVHLKKHLSLNLKLHTPNSYKPCLNGCYHRTIVSEDIMRVQIPNVLLHLAQTCILLQISLEKKCFVIKYIRTKFFFYIAIHTRWKV